MRIRQERTAREHHDSVITGCRDADDTRTKGMNCNGKMLGGREHLEGMRPQEAMHRQLQRDHDASDG